jgi:hypothetical protein
MLLPTSTAGRRGDPEGMQVRGQAEQAGVVDEAGKQLPDNGGLCRLDHEAAGGRFGRTAAPPRSAGALSGL